MAEITINLSDKATEIINSVCQNYNVTPSVVIEGMIINHTSAKRDPEEFLKGLLDGKSDDVKRLFGKRLSGL